VESTSQKNADPQLRLDNIRKKAPSSKIENLENTSGGAEKACSYPVALSTDFA